MEPRLGGGGGGSYLADSRQAASSTVAWAYASAPQWGETWVESIKILRFLAAIGGGNTLGYVPLNSDGVEFGSLAAFFSTSFKQKNHQNTESPELFYWASTSPSKVCVGPFVT